MNTQDTGQKSDQKSEHQTPYFKIQVQWICEKPEWTDLAGIVKQLVLKLLDAQDLLEHLVQLVLAEDELRRSTGRHPLLVFPGVLLPTVDGVKFGHPRAQHRLFAQAIDLRQTTHPLLYVLLKNLAGVAGGAAAALHHPGHAVAL